MKKSIGQKTLIYPTPIMIIGSYGPDGEANVMNAAWGGICCSKPPCVTVSLRKATQTYQNISARRAYTISIPSTRYMKEADYFGIVSGRNTDKFADTGLTPVRGEFVDAPYVGEFPIVMECKVLHIIELGLHTQFVGEVMDVKADPEVLNDKGGAPIDKVNPLVFDPDSFSYFSVGTRLGQAFSVGKELKK